MMKYKSEKFKNSSICSILDIDLIIFEKSLYFLIEIENTYLELNYELSRMINKYLFLSL